jgi:hypothetical protein
MVYIGGYVSKYIVIFIFLFCFIEIAQAEDRSGEQFTEIMGFQLGQTFQEIQNKLGKATIQQSGDASTGEDTICYSIQNSLMVIEFIKEELYYSYRLRRAGSKDQKKCSPISRELLPGDLPTRLRLGMTLQEFKKVLGPSIKSTMSVAEKRFHWKKAMTTSEAELQLRGDYLKNKTYYWDVFIIVKGTFDKGILVDLVVSKSEQD